MSKLLETFPKPEQLLSVGPEELGAILIEIIPTFSQQAGFVFQNITDQLFRIGESGYPPGTRDQVRQALAEALS